ncbi:hypothetical protein Tsubulata_004770 [Turnera subulata]|uniref:Uncharacterized protein n=1 Tax=Turnera subulata TaxID=218843 RepID=A0A9Q0J4A5_9ROSI|nr:hypothetical protein Tsubulata_004770 [Turnera subulata]
MQERATLHQEELQKQQPGVDQIARSTETVTGDACGPLLDELLSQAEAQELIIQDVGNLCEVAEAMCNAQQEQFVQSFIDLPVWSSLELMEALCDE